MNNYMNDFYANMAIKDFSPSTQKSYGYQLKFFLQHCQEKNKQINSETFKNYLFDLIKNHNLSNSSLKQNIGAVKFFLNSPLKSLMN